MSNDEIKNKLKRACDNTRALEDEIGKVLVGQRNVVREAIVAMIASRTTLR